MEALQVPTFDQLVEQLEEWGFPLERDFEDEKGMLRAYGGLQELRPLPAIGKQSTRESYVPIDPRDQKMMLSRTDLSQIVERIRPWAINGVGVSKRSAGFWSAQHPVSVINPGDPAWVWFVRRSKKGFLQLHIQKGRPLGDTTSKQISHKIPEKTWQFYAQHYFLWPSKAIQNISHLKVLFLFHLLLAYPIVPHPFGLPETPLPSLIDLITTLEQLPPMVPEEEREGSPREEQGQPFEFEPFEGSPRGEQAQPVDWFERSPQPGVYVSEQEARAGLIQPATLPQPLEAMSGEEDVWTSGNLFHEFLS